MKALVYKIDELQFDQENSLVYETIFHNANGYLGVRSNPEEGYPEGYHTIRGAYINGFYDIAEMKQAEKLCGLVDEKQTMLNLHDIQGISVWIDGGLFNMWRGTVKKAYRQVDMEAGVTERTVVWESEQGKQVRICVRRMASFTRQHLFLLDYSLTPLNFSGEVRLVSTHIGDVRNYCNPDDPRVAGESFEHLLTRAVEEKEGRSVIVSGTSKSSLEVCSAVEHRMEGAYTRTGEVDGDTVRESFYCMAKQDETVHFRKYCVFTDSMRTECVKKEQGTDVEAAVKAEAERLLCEAVEAGPEVLYGEQRDYLQNFWENSLLEIDGDEELNLALHYNIYQLLQSAGKDDFGNVAAKGLSGEGYEGHYFWDTEMYIQPFFALTNPELAKKLIEFRYRTLDGARENARMLGHKKGAAYPWRTIMGKECSGYFPSGSAAYHITGDVAYSVVNYYLLTGDLDFIEEKGAEIMLETARMWLDIGTWSDGQFRIHCVTGPDEYTCMVNNNYFTNAVAQYNLRWAYQFYRMLNDAGRAERLCGKLGFEACEAEGFLKAAEGMYLPYNEKLDINPQDDSFLSKKVWDFENTPKEDYPLLLHYHPMHLYRHQVCKQADTVLAHFILEQDTKMSTIRNSFEYYEKITTHDSSLSTCIFSIMASRLDLQEKAYEYFGDSAKLDLFNTHHNTKDGIHTANMGGNYMAIVYGFAGLRVKEKGISFSPILPKQWNGYRFRIQYLGSMLEISVNREQCGFCLLGGESRTVTVYGETYMLTDAKAVIIPREGAVCRAVIFDLDGVITDSAKYHFEAWKMIADELGIPFDEAFNEKLKGVPRIDSLKLILSQDTSGRTYSDEQISELAARKNEHYGKLISGMTKEDILPGIEEFLEELKAQGIKTGLASVSHNAGTILHRLELEQAFDYVADPREIRRLKPYPDIFLACADELGVRPSACVGIEDAASGITAINRAGMKSVGVGSPGEMGEADVITSTAELNVEMICGMMK